MPERDALSDLAAVTQKGASSVSAEDTSPEAVRHPASTVPAAAGSAATGFRISDVSPYNEDNPVERDFILPKGVFYRIQLAVYRNELAADHFGGLSPITTEAIPDRGLTRYFVGKFTRMEDVRSALVKVRALGYPDAFIVGYYDGQKSSFSKLKALEK